MKMGRFFSVGLLFFISYQAYSQRVFNNLDSLLAFATAKSKSIQSGVLRLDQAKKAKLAAVVGITDLSGGLSFTYTNNTQLPVNLFPAEIFGGEKGTFKEVKSGIQYVTNANEYVDVKLFNLSAWENLRLAKLNLETTQSDNRISLKNLHLNIASIYFNIVNLQEQRKAAQQNVLIADTLLQISTHKFEQGIGRIQEVNEGKSNYLNSQESVRQVSFQLRQQYNALKILCDFPLQDSISIIQFISSTEIPDLPQVQVNKLEVFNGILREKMAWSSYQQAKLALLPSVSMFFSNTRQQYNTAPTLFDRDVRWIPSNYLGIKLNWNIPSAQSLSQINKTRYDYLTAKLNTEHFQNKSEIEAKQLTNDFQKVQSQAKTYREVFKLKRDVYHKNLSLYAEGVIGLDQVMNNYSAMVNSHYNLIASSINVLLAQANIAINNNTK